MDDRPDHAANASHHDPSDLPEPRQPGDLLAQSPTELLAELFPSVAPDDLEKLARMLDVPQSLDDEETIEFFSQSWFGPMPSPHDLQGYKNVQDDLPERMMVNHELWVRAVIDSQKQALSIDDKLVTHQSLLEIMGISLTFILSAACVGATTWLATNGVWQAAIPIGVLPVTAGLTGLTVALRRLFRPGPSSQSGETDIE
jgi:uncharacterized membrane protein